MPPLLLLCSRIDGNADFYQRVASLAGQPLNWTHLLKQAQIHGLEPLLYRHLKRAGVTLSPELQMQLQGAYLQHRHANRIRAQTLAEILACYQEAGIEAVVVKGAVLAHLIYPEPGLRPMSDLDILVKPQQARDAQQLLLELGFAGAMPPPGDLPDKHLPLATRVTAGVAVHIEVHHNLFNVYLPASMTLDDVTPTPFTLPSGFTAMMPTAEQMLWHVCRHIQFHTNVWKPLRLIWVVDVVALAEHCADTINWAELATRYPLVLNMLSLFHHISPLSERLQAHLRLGRAPAGIGVSFEGWPHQSLASQRHKGYVGILKDTLIPSEWWLRLFYGLDSVTPLWSYRWLRHPLHMGRWLVHYALGRMGIKDPYQ